MTRWKTPTRESRWRGVVGSTDLSLSYLYQYDDFPVFPGQLVPGAGSGGSVGVSLFEPRYERTHVVGATGSTAVGDFTVRAELL